MLSSTLAAVLPALAPGPVAGQEVPVVTVPLAQASLAAGDRFGASVDLEGGLVAVGATFDDEVGGATGAVYVLDAATGALVRKLTVPGAGFLDQLGRAVALEGGVVLGTREDASALLFDLSTGAILQSLVASTSGVRQDYGYSGDFVGNRVAVGDRFWKTSTLSSNAHGAVWLFDPATGAQVAELTGPTSRLVGWFGESLALSATRCVVGAPRSDVGTMDSGGAYLFDSQTGALVAQLPSPDPNMGGLHGENVAIGGGLVAVAEIGDDVNGPSTGAVHLYDASTGAYLRSVRGAPGSSNDGFGSDVALSGGLLAIGASLRNGDEGAVFVHDAATGVLLHELVEQRPYWRAWFGSNLAFDGDRLVHADLRDDGYLLDAGSARVFHLPLECQGAPASLSLAAGGTQTLTITSGPSQAGNTYVLAGSSSGTQPGPFLGASAFAPLVPLVPDAYTLQTLGAGAPFVGGVGTLDASGSATASFVLPPGLSPTLAGTTLHHACVLLDPTPMVGQGVITRASTAAAVDLVP